MLDSNTKRNIDNARDTLVGKIPDPKAQVEQLVAQTPLGRLGKPEDIADAIAFLASPDARWVNGQNLGVNGGIL